MIDSHCHLDHEPLLSDLRNVIKRSKEVEIVNSFLIPTSFDRLITFIKLLNKGS